MKGMQAKTSVHKRLIPCISGNIFDEAGFLSSKIHCGLPHEPAGLILRLWNSFQAFFPFCFIIPDGPPLIFVPIVEFIKTLVTTKG
jgi:hypothetical protein